MGGGIKLGELFGIKIRLDWSWFFIFALLFLTYSDYFIENAQLNPALGRITGSIVALAVFASVLFHEMAHSLVAKYCFAVPVYEIRLFILGGIAIMGENPKTPKEELCVSVAGPLSSLFLAVFFGTLASVVEGQALVLLFGLLSTVNLVLFLFNLLPAFPLDGGKILKALLWGYWRDEFRAEEVSLSGGQILGALIIAAGFVFIFLQDFGGLWFIFVGWFIRSFANIGKRQLKIRKGLEDSNAAS